MGSKLTDDSRLLMQFLVVAVVATAVCVSAKTSEHPIVIVVSFDGFRYDYLKRLSDCSSNFTYLIERGVQAEWIQPSFPSLTFPNHHTIATGVYPETHGITANGFYDPILNDVFNMADTDPKWWDTGVTPLYILNEMAEKGRYSGAMMWAGSLSSYHNHTVTHHYKYDATFPFEDRVDIVMQWLTDDSKPANTVFLYFQEPDASGHWYGPDSPEVLEQIRRADKVIGYLIQELRQADLFERTDLIVTSDHGMASVPLNNSVDLTHVLNKTYYDDYNETPIIHINPKPGMNNVVYEAFREASFESHFTVYKKEDIPEVYHYRNNLRIPPIVLVADINYEIKTSPNIHLLGNHGFNNSLEEMRAFFIAHGPSFKKNYTSKAFKNVDIYPLVSYLLGVDPPPNNGTFEDVKDLLRGPDVTPTSNPLLILVAVIVVIIVSAVLFISLRFAYKKIIMRQSSDETRPVVYFGSLP